MTNANRLHAMSVAITGGGEKGWRLFHIPGIQPGDVTTQRFLHVCGQQLSG